jgi:SAM-dependent methyltransferase
MTVTCIPGNTGYPFGCCREHTRSMASSNFQTISGARRGSQQGTRSVPSRFLCYAGGLFWSCLLCPGPAALRLRCERPKISIFTTPPPTPGTFRAHASGTGFCADASRKFIRDRFVLELGCGEGHLTKAVFGRARSVVGIDISDVAIARAQSLELPHARFENADLLQISYNGYEVIAAIECIHYLSHAAVRSNRRLHALLQSQAIDARVHDPWLFSDQILQPVCLLASAFFSNHRQPHQVAPWLHGD